MVGILLPPIGAQSLNFSRKKDFAFKTRFFLVLQEAPYNPSFYYSCLSSLANSSTLKGNNPRMNLGLADLKSE